MKQTIVVESKVEASTKVEPRPKTKIIEVSKAIRVRSERHKQEMRNKSDKQEPGKAKRKK
jgi:hypothetical protein